MLARVGAMPAIRLWRAARALEPPSCMCFVNKRGGRLPFFAAAPIGARFTDT